MTHISFPIDSPELNYILRESLLPTQLLPILQNLSPMPPFEAPCPQTEVTYQFITVELFSLLHFFLYFRIHFWHILPSLQLLACVYYLPYYSVGPVAMLHLFVSFRYNWWDTKCVKGNPSGSWLVMVCSDEAGPFPCSVFQFPPSLPHSTARACLLTSMISFTPSFISYLMVLYCAGADEHRQIERHSPWLNETYNLCGEC